MLDFPAFSSLFQPCVIKRSGHRDIIKIFLRRPKVGQASFSETFWRHSVAADFELAQAHRILQGK